MDNQAVTRDVRNTQTWHEIEQFFHSLHGPTFGQISDADHLCPSPDGTKIAFTAYVWEALEGTPDGRIAVLDCNTSTMEILTSGPNSDKQPAWSADGHSIAFLSDREAKGSFQLMVGNAQTLAYAKPVSLKQHVAEYLQWSPHEPKLLVGMAGEGADKAGGEGSGGILSSNQTATDAPAWMPQISTKLDSTAWRSLWIFDARDGKLRRGSREGLNIWEAAWCGPDHALAVASDDPTEDSWYTARLVVINVNTGLESLVYQSSRQLALPASSVQGNRLAVVEAACSDRGVVAGDLLLFDRHGQQFSAPTRCRTAEIDVSSVVFSSEHDVFCIGQRGLQTCAGIADSKCAFREVWSSGGTCGSRYPNATPFRNGFIAVTHSWLEPPAITMVDERGAHVLARFDRGAAAWLQGQLGPTEEVSWKAPDGLLIQGLLHLPKTTVRPLPLILHVHGGPIWAFRNIWAGLRPWVALLVSRGYAVLDVNPRGSGGRGQEFAGLVIGDMGGADTLDYLSGLDMLVEQGIADPERLGVHGGSYGGFMSAWIITQTDRFAAAIPNAPVTDWFTQHTTSNIGLFDAMFLDNKPYALDGLYAKRSPVRVAGTYKTPVLQISGADDRCTPPVNAVQYHNALLERGVESVLVTYPGEGHGVRKFPAHIDYCFRIVSWFDKYMGPRK